ncbi:hypothetical protein [Ammonifex thiophilus]|uniref:hypothetical protein n=1 Tax=Ammonifex thiophilus TaxID=444093 RepID=UPI00106AD310|nr:hypothetical protein [Ammonifex thiophilus]
MRLEELASGDQGEDFYPLLVLFSAILCGYPLDKVLPLAAGVKFLFWGNVLHRRAVLGSGSKTRSRLLWGDYCYGVLFYLLAEEELRRCLAPLARVVKAHCEAPFIPSGREFGAAREVLALLGGESCCLPALLAGKKRWEKELYGFGFAFGQAHALLLSKGMTAEAERVLSEARSYLLSLPGGEGREGLERLVESLLLIPAQSKECSEAR